LNTLRNKSKVLIQPLVAKENQENMRKSSKRFTPQNRNARIRSRFTLEGRRRTETAGRDPGTLRVGVSTDDRNNSTFMTISRGEEYITLTGREALTVLRTLEQHNSENPDSSFLY
jgi:hypothetical protein